MSRLLTVALCAGWAFVVAGGISIPANAATCTTTNSISVTTNGGDTASCSQASNSGNINGNPMTDDWMPTHPGFVFLDASDNGSGLANGALTISTTPGGAWSINAALVGGYTNFALGIKLGNFNPDWAVFLLGGNWNLGGVLGKIRGNHGSRFLPRDPVRTGGTCAGATRPSPVLVRSVGLGWARHSAPSRHGERSIAFAILGPWTQHQGSRTFGARSLFAS